MCLLQRAAEVNKCNDINSPYYRTGRIGKAQKDTTPRSYYFWQSHMCALRNHMLGKECRLREGSPGRNRRVLKGQGLAQHVSATILSRCTTSAQPALSSMLPGRQDKGMNSRPQHPTGEMTHVLRSRVIQGNSEGPCYILSYRRGRCSGFGCSWPPH